MTIVKTAVDAWVDQAQPTVRHGAKTRLALNGPTGTNDRRAFIHFSRPFPLGAVILSAKLRVFTAAAWTGSHTVTAKRVTAKWQEKLIAWNNQPAVTATNQASVAANSLAPAS